LNNLPIATQWLLNATAALPSQVVLSVTLVITTSTRQKGTGWLVSDRHVVTNEHVVRGGEPTTIQVRLSDGTILKTQDIIVDAYTDIAVITLESSVSYKPLQVNTNIPEIGTRIYAWGHPLGYNGPPPILSVGYVAGFNAHHHPSLVEVQRRLVLNAALNPGNSGGPIFCWGEQFVCGIAVTKHAPIPQDLRSAIDALRNDNKGILLKVSDDHGNTKEVVESQIIAEILYYFRGMTQVVIGEAIAAEDLVKFLDKHSIPWTSA
jgi:hypothetical protein